MVLLQQNGNMRLFCGFATKKVMTTMSLPSFMVVLLWKKQWLEAVFSFFFVVLFVITPLWAKCKDETHTPKSGNLESFGTPENSKLDCRGQNTLHRGFLYTVGKFLK